MTAISPPHQIALAAYRSALAGARGAVARETDSASEDRGARLDVVVEPLRAVVTAPAARALLAGIPTRYALPLTAASGC